MEVSETVTSPEETSNQRVKTSVYLTQDQLDKLEDLTTDYNKRYRRQRKKIDRQDILRYLVDQCTSSTLEDLQLP